MSQSSTKRKHQPSISSFFAKAAPPTSSSNGIKDKTPDPNGRAAFPTSQSTSPPSVSPVADERNGLKDGDNAGSSSRKRIKSNTWKSGKEDELQVSPINGSVPDKAISCTDRFRFQPSQQTEIANGGDIASETERRRKDQLHKKFVQRLGGPDCLPSRLHDNIVPEIDSVADTADDDGNSTVRQNEPVTASTKRARSAKKLGDSKLTPLEKQIVGIKRSHLDAILLFEVGYKYQFYGEDARIAAKELGIVCIPGKMRFDEPDESSEDPSEAHLDRFASASIPTHRRNVHVKRLVTAGHKVGIVEQVETAALKAAGDNRNAPFVRKLTNMYTKGTYIEQDTEFEISSGTAAHSTGYLFCLTEGNAKGQGNNEKVQIGMIAVQPATGDVIHDAFEDGFMRSEIETRLLHIAPCELLIVGELSTTTNKLVQHLSKRKMSASEDCLRVEHIPKTKQATVEAHNHISNFYARRMADVAAENVEESSKLLDTVLNLPGDVAICLSAMIKHLTEYGLEHVFDLTKYFQSFSARSHMLLTGNTLINLEIYQNQTDHSSNGSLFWSLDRTKTKFGQRLLRTWVGRPLLDRAQLEGRVAAVTELLDGERSALVDRLGFLLSKTKIDLEKILIRIYYGRCTRSELLTMLKAMQSIATEFAHIKSTKDTGFTSPMLSECILVLPTVLEDVIAYLNRINEESAKKNDKYDFFREAEESEEITDHRGAIATIECELQDHRKDIATTLGKPKVDYVSVAGIDYLIPVENSAYLLKKVPASWRKISGTKSVSRFHTPEVVKMMRERDQHKESLAAACDRAFSSMLADISAKYQLFRDCIQALATLDALLSLSLIARQPGYVMPSFTDDTVIQVEQGRHPMVEQLLLDSYVPNDTSLSTDKTRALLVTGPNMGGKSSYVRQIALICIMGQIGSYVPAASATLGMLDAVYTRMGAFDNMLAGESTFMVELSETADILKQATRRSLVILDELGRGTSTHDGVAIAQAVLDYMVRDIQSLTLFITHYQNLSDLAKAFPNGELRNVHMKFTETGTQGQDITFLYEVGEGVAHRSYGLNVAKLAHLPVSILEVAHAKSAELEAQINRKNLSRLIRDLSCVLGDGDVGENWQSVTGRLLSDIEQF
ncbi:Mismatch repair protein msh3 [Myotisia sp. PD_48]|nr:Mismatch repair protein msh3 [Myotisia sp. PD_48]